MNKLENRKDIAQGKGWIPERRIACVHALACPTLSLNLLSATLGPWCCTWTLSSCGEGGLLLSCMWNLPGLNSCALHWQTNSQPLDHQGSLCPTLCYPMGCSPPGSSFHGIFQARILEWIAISTSRGSSRPRDWSRVSSFSCIGRQILYHFEASAWAAHILK